MRIILKDPTLILTAVVGGIFSFAMIGLLLQLTTDVDQMRQSWDQISCPELQKFLSSPEYDKLSESDSENFQNALKKCTGTQP